MGYEETVGPWANWSDSAPGNRSLSSTLSFKGKIGAINEHASTCWTSGIDLRIYV